MIEAVLLMGNLLLHWHRRDLRLHDHLALTQAREQSAQVVGLFCLDPEILQGNDIAPARVKYLLACLRELAASYQAAGSELLCFNGSPLEVLPRVAIALQARQVSWCLDVEPYAQQRDEQVAIALRSAGIKLHTVWDQVLHAPGQVLTKTKKPYTVYSPFWKNWSSLAKERPSPPLKDCQSLSPEQRTIAEAEGAIAIPSVSDLGFTWEQPFTVPVGEAESLAQLETFQDNALEQYQGDRNQPALEGTSRLSAALKFGAIGIRTLWQATIQAQEFSRSDEATASIRTWQQELAWREFYQHCLFFFPDLAQGPYREDFKDFPWDNNPEHFTAWCQGKTGYPIVDAAMRQLNATGWMHNRCRMIVASFLTKDLIIDWRLGEQYFMQTLVDGDLSANNGGWQWSASSGMDPKPLRIFNPYTQAQKFDAEAAYIREWVPEIRHLDTKVLLSGIIPPLIAQQCNYPEAIVTHAVQQREFKRRYKLQRERNNVP